MLAHNKNKHTPSPPPSPPPAPCDNDQCGICEKTVTTTDKAILCNQCNRWIHITCNKITIKTYKYYQENPESTFECKNCKKCGVCNTIVAKNHHVIECIICPEWIHIKCNKFSDKEYRIYQENSEYIFCINCMADSLKSYIFKPITARNPDRFNEAINNITFKLDEDNTETESENSVLPHNQLYLNTFL